MMNSEAEDEMTARYHKFIWKGLRNHKIKVLPTSPLADDCKFTCKYQSLFVEHHIIQRNKANFHNWQSNYMNSSVFVNFAGNSVTFAKRQEKQNSTCALTKPCSRKLLWPAHHPLPCRCTSSRSVSDVSDYSSIHRGRWWDFCWEQTL